MSDPKKYYRVIAEMSSACRLVIKAKDKNEAWKIAKQADGGDFEELPQVCNWEIYSVEQMKEEDGNKEEVLDCYDGLKEIGNG
jgi:hypothetical protein